MNQKYRKVYCGYCEKRAEVVDGHSLYGYEHKLSNKKFYCCKPCEAWVGMHEGSNKPFGSLANAKLRKKRLDTHKAFDVLWRDKQNPTVARKQAYSWLASKMVLDVDQCHIGMFDIEQCNLAIRFCLIKKKSA